MIHVLDNAIVNPAAYRQAVLSLEFRSYDFGHCVFHGIATSGPAPELLAVIASYFPHLVPSLTFFRKSPDNQVEPHYIHTDVDMGEWSAVLYLNEDPPETDGTSFWTHRETGAIESVAAHERSAEGNDSSGWSMRLRVPARFNRLLLFPSTYFHSRSIAQNWGRGESARLTQVAFGTGRLTPKVSNQ